MLSTRIATWTIGVVFVGCAGSESRPPQAPTTMSSTSPPMAETRTTVAADIRGPAAHSDGAVNTSQNPSATQTSAAYSGSRDSNAAYAAMGMADAGYDASRPGAALDDRAMADHRNDADNTGINKRDRNDTVTPIDQGNDARDTKITAAIRKWMMSDTTLSFAAKNVKIITIDSKVTLRGPVKSDREKSTIEAMAKQTDGVREVDDQIEVKGQ